MTPQLRDFVSTYRPPIQPEPFFGFFEEPKPRVKRKWKKRKLPKVKPDIIKNFNKHYRKAG